MRYSSVLIVFISFVFASQSCKKTDTGINTPRPSEITLISGNNQIGYPNKELSDSIIIKITPRNIGDTLNYSFYFSTTEGYLRPSSEVIGNSVFVKAQWTLGSGTSDKHATFILYGNCPDFMITNQCRVLDSSIKITATINTPWKLVYTQANPSGQFYDIHFSDAMNGVVVGAANTGLLRTTDGGQSWYFVNSPRNDFYMLSFADSKIGLGIVTNNWAYFTNDGGNTFTGGAWAPPTIGDHSSSDYFMIDRDTIYSVGVLGAILKSTNGGLGWTKYTGFKFINQLFSINCPSSKTCYACGDVAKIVKTSDGGNTWTEQEILINNVLRKIYFVNDNFGFAGGQYGVLVRTTDGGKNWNIIKTGLRFDIIEIKFFSSLLGYLITREGEIAKTTDGGLTWQIVVKEGFPVYSLNKAYLKDSTIAYGLMAGQIYSYNLKKN